MFRVRLPARLAGLIGLLPLALAAPALAQDDGATPYAEASAGGGLYAPPPVRPFEAPSDFGEEEEQGDARWTGSRAPLTAPVEVEDYVGQYEYPPAANHVAFEQAVTEYELRADAMMGPLDGRWRAYGPQGRALLALDLRDPEGGRRVEGAWRDLTAPPAAPELGVLVGVRRDSGVVQATLEDEGSLSIRRGARGLVGTLERNGREISLTLTPVG